MENGIVAIQANKSIDDLVVELTALLHSRGVKLFAVIDHSGEAAAVGISMPTTKLLIFGNPAAGTPLMLKAPTLALDLPLKMLIFEDQQGKRWLSFNSADYLAQRHDLPEAARLVLAAPEAMAKALVA